MERNYENLILETAETEADECVSCPHKGNCRNQCLEMTGVYNPLLYGWRE